MIFNIFKRISCFRGKHKYNVIDVDSTGAEKIECKVCKKKRGINHRVETVLDWDNELEELFVVMMGRHSKKWPENRKWFQKGK